MNKEKPDFELSFAKYTDVDDIQALLEPYYKESTYSGLTYDPHMAKQTISGWIGEYCVIAKVDGKIVGIVALYFFKTYYKETEADIMMFYVCPKYRGTGISRALVNTVVMGSDKCGASVIYTSCGSGISKENNIMYTNLFKKFGFKDLGTELVRKNG